MKLRDAAARAAKAEAGLAAARADLRAAITEAHTAGVSLARIGRELGISRQRVATIIKGGT